MHPVPLAHHVVGEDGQQQFQFIWVDVDIGLDRISWPDGPALKHLGTKSLAWDKIKVQKIKASYHTDYAGFKIIKRKKLWKWFIRKEINSARLLGQIHNAFFIL